MRTRRQAQDEQQGTSRRRPPPPPPPRARTSQSRAERTDYSSTGGREQEPYEWVQVEQDRQREIRPLRARYPGGGGEGDEPEPPAAEEQQPQQQDMGTQTDRSDWILRLRAPPRRSRDDPLLPSIIQIHVTAHMNSRMLAACVQQIVEDDDEIVGLFVESTGLFVSLDHLLSASATMRRQVYALYHRPPPPPGTPWWKHIELWIAVGIVIIGRLLYVHKEIVMRVLWTAAVTSYDMTIQLPLKELYRHGPWFVGWEGDSLPRICARITYHGDAAFWSRNLEECQRIYAAKEEAYLRLARPAVYAVVMVFFVAILRFIVWELTAPRERPRPPTDRDMVETYRAFQVIMGQVRKQLTPRDDRQHHHQHRR